MSRTGQHYAAAAHAAAAGRLADRYRAVRAQSLARVAPLSPEDAQAQSMPDASPAKWHLAHVTWFFETFLLSPNLAGYQPFDPDFAFLFNSYYEALGPPAAAAGAGLITRPPLSKVLAYRSHVDAAMERLLAGQMAAEAAFLVELGLSHEEQHQELILMDVLHLFAQSAIKPAVRPRLRAAGTAGALDWVAVDGGVVEIGARADGFRLRQRKPAPRDPAAALPAGQPPGHQPRMDRLHRGRRLSAGRVLAVRRLGAHPRGRLGGAALLGARRGRLAGVRPGRADARRSRCAGGARQLLRGRRLRPLGRQAAADRGGVGTRRRRARAGRVRAAATTPPGSGPPAPTSPIPASPPPKARSANTTASS